MKTSYKLFLISFMLMVSSYKAVITIKRLTLHELNDFVLYQNRIPISSYRTEEEVTTPRLVNYLPVKIKLVGGPEIEIKKITNKDTSK